MINYFDNLTLSFHLCLTWWSVRQSAVCFSCPCLRLLSTMTLTSLTPSLITLSPDGAPPPAGQDGDREGDPVHLVLTFCCLVAAFCFSFSLRSIYGLILTYLATRHAPVLICSFQIMIKIVLKAEVRNFFFSPSGTEE